MLECLWNKWWQWLKSNKTGRNPVHKKQPLPCLTGLPVWQNTGATCLHVVFWDVLPQQQQRLFKLCTISSGHRAHSIDKYNQYRARAWTDAFHSQPASVPVVKLWQIVGRWPAERLSLQSTRPADTMLHDTTITGQASMFVFTVRLVTRTSKHPSMRMDCKFELRINLWIRWFNLECLFALPNLHVWEISLAICPV